MSSEAGFYSFEPTLLASIRFVHGLVARNINDIDNIKRERETSR